MAGRHGSIDQAWNVDQDLTVHILKHRLEAEGKLEEGSGLKFSSSISRDVLPQARLYLQNLP